MNKNFSFDLTGRTALVTGASSGIGRRFAFLLAKSGANVVVAARRTALLEDLCLELRNVGGKAIAVPMNAADEASIIAAYDATEAAFGTVDTVVANAGVGGHYVKVDVADGAAVEAALAEAEACALVPDHARLDDDTPVGRAGPCRKSGTPAARRPPRPGVACPWGLGTGHLARPSWASL